MSSISDVSDNLAKIIDMAGRLEARAIDRACDRLMPGGEALAAMIPTANREAFGYRLDTAEQNEMARRFRTGDHSEKALVDLEHEDPDELWTPEQILRWWSDDYRQQLGMEHDDPAWRPTLVSEATFLRNRDVAEWIWEHETQWDAYAADVSRARAKMESILLEGTRSERSRVVCGNEQCDDPRTLIRVYAKRQPVEWSCLNCLTFQDHPDACGNCPSTDLVEIGWSSNKDDDLWKCGGCKSKYTHEQVRDFYAKQLRRVPEKWMPVTHAMQLMREQGWQERVSRSWLDDLEVRTEDVSGRREVLWSSLWRRHLLETNARQQRAHERAKKTPDVA